MNEYHILYFFLSLGLIGVIGKIIKKEKFKIENESHFHRFYLLGYYSLFFLGILYVSNHKYYGIYAELDRIEERIPSLTKDLYLISRTENSEKWVNRNDKLNKSHYVKDLKIENIGITSETDYFINRNENINN